MFFEQIEQLEDNFVKIQAAQFDYWSHNNLSINSSFGAAREGWIKTFENLCSGLDILSANDDSDLQAGEIVIYFDNLLAAEIEIHQAFKKCVNVAEYTPKGNNEIQVIFSNGQTRSYRYFNLLPGDYIPLEVQIEIQYKKGGQKVKDADIEKDFLKSFEEKNRINLDFYPESFLDAYSGVADFVISSKREGDTSFSRDIRTVGIGNKFVLNGVSIKR
ncbi:MAG: hypothetical protein ACRCVN_05995 [Spirochaetia bacterium]